MSDTAAAHPAAPERLTRPRVVVSVGTDHHPFDRMIDWIDEWSAAFPTVPVMVQRGTSDPPAHCPSERLVPHSDLIELFAMAEVVVSHGGPSTVMDARMVGRLPIVVARNPELGEHVDGHQMRFADHLRRHDLAVVIDDKDAFFGAMSEALADPSRFSIPIDTGSISGVVEFGRVMDHLLGTTTPLTPSSPAGVDDIAHSGVVVGPQADTAAAERTS